MVVQAVGGGGGGVTGVVAAVVIPRGNGSDVKEFREWSKAPWY